MAISFAVFVDPRYDASERAAIGNAIIEYIVARTKRGRGIGNVAFKTATGSTAYTKTYQAHRDFDIAGKDPRPINLTLSGDMLNSIEVIDVSLAGRIVIGISDDQNASKAEWLRDKGYKFLGMTEDEIQQITSRFTKLTPSETTVGTLSTSIARNFLRGLLGG